MGLEVGTYIEDLVTTNPVGASDFKSAGDDHIRLLKTTIKNTFPGLAGRILRIQSKAGAYTLAATDNLTLLSCTGSWTLAALAAATLGNGYSVVVSNVGTGTITIDPYPAETVNGQSTFLVQPGQTVLLQSTGTALLAIVLDDGGLLNAGTASGTNTYTATLQRPLRDYEAGKLIAVTFTNANTSTAVTLNVESLGARNIKSTSGGSIATGAIGAGHVGLLLDTGAHFMLLNPVSLGLPSSRAKLFAHRNFI